jgi:hypothetical protein
MVSAKSVQLAQSEEKKLGEKWQNKWPEIKTINSMRLTVQSFQRI